MTPHKIIWFRNGMRLRAEVDYGLWPSNPGLGLNERDMDPIHQWSRENNCGTRVSFDTWQFRTDEEMTVFLLRWA
jgi:hypothetical protein